MITVSYINGNLITGRSESGNFEFDIMLDKLFKWRTESVEDRQSVVVVLWRV